MNRIQCQGNFNYVQLLQTYVHKKIKAHGFWKINAWRMHF
jgi:hypothetical protein